MTPAPAPVPPIAQCRQTQGIASISIGVTALIALVLVHQRGSVANPFELPIFRHLILFQDYYALLPFIVVLLAALAPPVRRSGLRLAGWCGRHPGPLSLATVVLLAVGSHAVYHLHPLSMDEYTAVFQSRIFAEGRLAGAWPPALAEWLAPPWLQGRFIRMSAETGAAVSSYWPGFSLLLAPFTALQIPWLLNPLVGGATVLVMHRLAMALFDSEESAGLVVLLTLASPAITINAISFYSMPAHLLANALFALLLLRPDPARAFYAGLAGSIALVLHSPVPHLLFALPWTIWLLLRPDRVRILAWLIAGYLPLALLLGWGWPFFIETVAPATAVSTGNALEILIGRLRNVAGWSSDTGRSGQLYGLAKLWLWAVPALLSVAALGAWRALRAGGAWLPLIGSALLTYLAYFLVPFDQGHGWGFRYFHSAWLVLPLLAVAALQRADTRSALPGYLSGSAVLSLAFLTTLAALQVEHFMSRHLSQLPAAPRGIARVIVIDRTVGYYAWDLAQNDPFLRNQVVRLISRGPQSDREMMTRIFPQHSLLEAAQGGTVWGVRERPPDQRP
jgi:hypothetical protein